MIQKFVDKFMANKDTLKEIFSKKHPESYAEIVKHVITLIAINEDIYEFPDPSRIHEIDDGDYQGTLLFIIAEGSYQPDTYYVIKIFYGSCSGCDTLEGIHQYSDRIPDEDQVADYMTLALHIIQNLTKIAGDTI